MLTLLTLIGDEHVLEDLLRVVSLACVSDWAAFGLCSARDPRRDDRHT